MNLPITAGPDDNVAVITWLPGRIATVFQAEAASTVKRLLVAYPSNSDSFTMATWDSSVISPPFNSNHRGSEDPWTAFEPLRDTIEGRKVACWIVDNLTEGGRTIVAELLTHPDGIRTSDLAERAGYGPEGISSAFRAIAGRFRSWGVRPFWSGNPDSKGHARGQLLHVDTRTDAYRVFVDAVSARFLI